MTGDATALSDDERRAARWRWIALGAVVLATTVVRLWLVRHCPEPDTDAKGHLGIAAALRTDPWNVAAHWVWPPAYHYLLAVLLSIGFDAQRVRLLDCALAAILPVMVWRYGERTLHPSSTPAMRLAPFLAGVLLAVMPVVNLLGTSAQPGTVFTMLVLGVAWSLDSRRFVLGGVLLAFATMVRYEACGAVAILLGLRVLGLVPSIARRLPSGLAKALRFPIVVVALPLLAIGGWFVAHRYADGSWLTFLRELYKSTHAQREAFHQPRWFEILWFPVIEPYFLFGLTIPLFFLGIRRAARVGWLVPLGVYLFLLGSYAFKGALGSARYYESLTPFECLAAGYGAALVGEKKRWALPAAFGVALAHVAWLLVQTDRWTFHI